MNRKKTIIYLIVLLVALAGLGVAYALNRPASSPPPSTNPNTDNMKQTDTDQTKTGSNPDKTDIHKSATPWCVANDLAATATIDQGGGAAGSVYATLTLTNRADANCTTGGFPGVSLLKGAEQVGKPADKSGNSAGTFILAPGKSAVASIRFVQDNYPAGTCQSGANQLRVYAPNDTHELIVTTPHDTWCPGFSVTALKERK